MKIKANCKINIGLDVIRRREDGYHDIETLIYPIKGLYDEITIERRDIDDVEFTQSGIELDCSSEDNICIKAYYLMQHHYATSGVSIHLDKRAPFGAGLGSGSADAMAVVAGINSLFNLNLSEDELLEHALELGSDTAFFIHNTAQLCQGRGEVMAPVTLDLEDKWLVIIKPEVNVSTAEAYAGIKPHLPDVSLYERLMEPIERWQESIGNAFEEHIFAQHPCIAAAKEELKAAGAIYASMSGSGSAVYGIFDANHPEEELKALSRHYFRL